MARIAYDDRDAAAFTASRHLPGEALTGWREAIQRHLQPRPGMRILDLGAGTGLWTQLFTAWFDDVDMIAVEPSAAMRARSVVPGALAGDAGDIPQTDDSMDGAWLSTVVHHIPDLSAAARELRRVLRPGAPVLIRSAFAGRPERILLFRYFPEAIRVLDTFPSVATVQEVFASAGFTPIALEPIPQTTSPSLRELLSNFRREAHTPLQLITDAEYQAGLARMRTAAKTDTGPVVDALDLLVMR